VAVDGIVAPVIVVAGKIDFLQRRVNQRNQGVRLDSGFEIRWVELHTGEREAAEIALHVFDSQLRGNLTWATSEEARRDCL
jgi:hypothetical protein